MKYSKNSTDMKALKNDLRVGDRIVVVAENKYAITDRGSVGEIIAFTGGYYDITVSFESVTGTRGFSVPFLVDISSQHVELDPISRSPLWEALK